MRWRRWSAGGRTAAAIFEYDRATEGLAYVIERKLKRYAEGLDGFAFARVIAVVDQARRREQLAEHTARTLNDARFTFLCRDVLAQWSVRELLDWPGSGERSGESSGVRTGLDAQTPLLALGWPQPRGGS